MVLLHMTKIHNNHKRITTITITEELTAALFHWRCSFYRSEAEYLSGPCNPLKVMCSDQHSTEPADTFKQSALFMKGRLCRKRGRRTSVKAKKKKKTSTASNFHESSTRKTVHIKQVKSCSMAPQSMCTEAWNLLPSFHYQLHKV